jgi:hypothetical protein
VVVVVVGGVVVVVVAGVVVAVVADEEAEVEVDAGSVVVVVAGAAVVEVAVVVEVDEPAAPVVGVATVEEWAVVPDATRTPSPTAPADAATAIPVVARRTLLIARSRDRAAGSVEGLRSRGCGAMVASLVRAGSPVGAPACRCSMGPLQRICSRATFSRAVGHL